MTENESAAKAATLLTEIVRRISSCPDRVQIQPNVHEGVPVFDLYASPTDIRILQDAGGRMARSLESIAHTLFNNDGHPVRPRFFEETKS